METYKKTKNTIKIGDRKSEEFRQEVKLDKNVR